jgi:two-component system, cell cycle response regulator DivK
MHDISHWKIILVDDELDSLNLIYDMLTLNGAEVHQTTNGNQGLLLLETVQPTLIVVDLSMPHPDGWDVLNAVRANQATSHVPVVAVTAYYSDEVSRRAMQAGFNAFIPKPIRVNSFLDTLREVIG